MKLLRAALALASLLVTAAAWAQPRDAGTTRRRAINPAALGAAPTLAPTPAARLRPPCVPRPSRPRRPPRRPRASRRGRATRRASA